MKIQQIDISKLKPAPYNPREISDDSLERLRKSLDQFGSVEPLVWNKKTGHVVGGNQRLKLYQEQGLKKVSCSVVELSRKREKILNLRLNNLSGTWDWPKVGDLLKELDKADWPLTGFDDCQIEPLVFDAPIVEDEIPEPPKKAITNPGDLWKLGEHRVLCGDATRAEDVARLMATDKAQAVVTDPPYGIGFGYESHDDSRRKWFGLMDVVVPMMRLAAPFVVMPCCGIDRMRWWYENHAPDWLMAWYKGSPGHRSHVGFNDWEALLVWGKPPKQMHDYFQTACGFEHGDHPCPKPVAWGAWLCERAAELGRIILDPFLGSGTTLIAAEQLGRKCYGLEIEPKYCDVIVERWQNLTGGKAKLDNGKCGKPKAAKRTKKKR